MPTSLPLCFITARLPTYLIKELDSNYAIMSKYIRRKLELG